MTSETQEMTREEFVERFVTKMIAVASETSTDGESVREYARQAAEAAFDDPDQREDGPEECALTDISYWEQG